MRCKACGLVMLPVPGFDVHPACGDDPGAVRIRADHAARQAGLEGQTLAATGSPDDFALALHIIYRTASRLRVFSANDITEPRSPNYDARWGELSNKVPGAAMGTAARRGWCRKTGHTVPAGGNGKGHSIPAWESRIFVPELAENFSVGTGAA